jgi:hypothetical protein
LTKISPQNTSARALNNDSFDFVEARNGAVLGCADERSVEVVGPAVVRASQRLLLTRACDEAGAAMAAGVEVRADAAVFGANDDDLLGADRTDDP